MACVPLSFDLPFCATDTKDFVARKTILHQGLRVQMISTD